MKAPGFAITNGKGFHVAFANGWTASIQFGPYNYCEKRERRDALDTDSAFDGSYSANAEIAAWDAAGNWYSPDEWGDTVKGYQTPAEVLEFLTIIAGMARSEVAA